MASTDPVAAAGAPVSPIAADLARRVAAFVEERVVPAEAAYFAHVEQPGQRWAIPPVMEELKRAARAEGLWNLWCPHAEHGAGLNNRDYAPLAEIMGRSLIAPEVFNCNAPDTGNMEVLIAYGTPAQQDAWLRPLLAGEIRSAFCMTEPDVASSDATNIEASIRRDGDHYVINGRKWWSTGAMDPRCRILVVMGKTDPAAERHRQQSMILVPVATPGVTLRRALTVFGADDAPHGHAEVTFDDVRVPADNMLLGEGRGFEIAQGRLGPGRIHHCMRLIGAAQRALEMMCRRAQTRIAFGRPLADQGVVRQQIALSACEIEQGRLLALAAADAMDRVGNKAARALIAMAKIAIPAMAQTVIDRAIQVHGAAGLSQDTVLAGLFAYARTIRLADGPDEVHQDALARQLLKAWPA